MKFKTIFFLLLFSLNAYSKEKLSILDDKLEKFNPEQKYNLNMKYNLFPSYNKENKNLFPNNNKKDFDFDFDVKLNEEKTSLESFKIGIDKKFKGIN